MRKRSTGSSSRAERSRPTSRRPLQVDGPVPLRPEEIAAVLELVGVEPSRSLGQNFLVDRSVADREAALLDVAPGTEVLEIGGGLGSLTRSLLDRGFRVTVVEREPRFAAYLATNFAGRIRVIEGDARTAKLPEVEVCAGNLPFSAAHEILARLVREGMQHGAFLVQREVADRLVAKEGSRDYGRPSVLFRVDGVFLGGGRVPSASFHPRPAVDGALVVWRRDPLDPAPRDRPTLETLLEVAFEQRRKILGRRFPGALARRFPVPAEKVPALVEAAVWPLGWDRLRAEEIAPERFVALANLLPPPSRRPTGSPAPR